MNRASQIPPTLPGGSIARGAAFTIHGSRFGPAAAVSLRIGQGASPVRVLAVEPNKIEAIMQDTAPLGAASLVVKAGGSDSKPFPLEVTASNPGIFSQNKRGWGPGQIENLDPSGKRILNSTTNPAYPGQRVAMRITGLGGETAIAVVGNRNVKAQLMRTIPQSGEQEISFAIPVDAPMGCFVPVYLKAAPSRASNVVTVAIASGADSCDPGPFPLLAEKRIGVVVIGRGAVLNREEVNIGDEAIGLFIAKPEGPALSPLRLVPPPGSCTAYTSSFQAATILPTSISGALIAEFLGDGLAAGQQLTLTRENQRRFIPESRIGGGSYRGLLDPKFLEPGKFILTGVGGMDVGPFLATVDGPAPFEWTDRDQTRIVERNRPLALNWRGQPGGYWTILVAANVDQITTAIGTCLCTAPLNTTHFEIPAEMLANIPRSIDQPGLPYDQLFVVSLPAKATPLTAAGLEAGAIITIYANGRFVHYH